MSFPSNPKNNQEYEARADTVVLRWRYVTADQRWIIIDGGGSGVGPTGAQGVTGKQGSAGTPGVPGAQGVTGLVGPAGTGATGSAGQQGVTGLPGSAGSAGTQGASGAQGQTGQGTKDRLVSQGLLEQQVHKDLLGLLVFRWSS